MNKVFFSISILLFLFLATSCQKKLKSIDPNGEVSFIVRLPSIALARFEARCVSSDIFLDRVIIQSPSSTYFTEEFNHNRYEKNEAFLFGNLAAEDGMWLITFVGVSAITNIDFQQIVPYEMVIGVDDDN